jgi:hypothetical protein
MIKRTKVLNIVIVIGLVGLLMVNQGLAVYAQTAPTPPPGPTAPPAPTDAPSAPTPPPAPTAPPAPTYTPDPTSTPPAPTQPPVPTESPSVSSTPTPTPVPTATPASGSTSSPTPSPSSTPAPDDGTGHQSDDSQVGGASVQTGDATNSASVTNDANSNLSAKTSDSGSGPIEVINDSNGDSSTNNSSATIINDSQIDQTNDAVAVNNLTQTTTSGDNSASRNVGDSSIVTGDANTAGTLVNSLNTNIDAVMVAEFNIADDYMGDYVLDYAGNCISGCGGGDVLAENTGNGADTTNNVDITEITNDATFQENNADVENNMYLASNSGDNMASRNTGGDSSIVTGDANVSADLINFVNNNLAGNVVIGVVNIFGDLIGDIIVPGDCCGSDVLAVNSSNGDGSTNTTTVNSTTDTDINQFNNADIENNLVFAATTGDNDTSRNTNGTNYVETGDANVLAQVLNITNLNLVGGDYWLVLVNDAGQWIGNIIGAPGSKYAGSSIFEFMVGENGELTVANSGNGADSVNNVSVTTENNTEINQTNNAKIVNNVNLSANTGGNSASRNTGGNNSIITGDANIVANIVNFVNNNIVGDGRLFVNVINVFGSWLGDFVGPGMAKAPDDSSNNTESTGTGGVSEFSSNSSLNGAVISGDADTVFADNVAFNNVQKDEDGNVIGFAGFSDDSSGFTSGGEKVLGSNDVAGKRIINVNLAYFVLFGGLIGLYFGLGKLRKVVLPRQTAKVANV